MLFSRVKIVGQKYDKCNYGAKKKYYLDQAVKPTGD
jgi:hypothetical protein